MSTRKQPSLPRGDKTGQAYQYANNNQKRCYNCNATGHFSRNCPVRGRAAPVESRGRNNSNQGPRNSEAKKVATIVPENSKTQTEGQEKIVELREALKQAEIEESLKDASTMINVLSPAKGNKNDNITLGPTLTSEVAIEGKTVKALLDTGSPVTILSLDHLFNHWAQQKKAGQTVEQWKEEVRNRLQNPSLILRNYGGNELDILKETTVKLERGGYSCTAVVLLQKNPPHDLLIGTDLLPLLGFQLIQKTVNSKIAVDMFSHKECNVGEAKEKVGEPPKQDLVNSSLEVKLISAVRVPAQHEKLIKAKVCKKSLDRKVAVFEMDSNFAKDSGVTIDEALVKPSSDK